MGASAQILRPHKTTMTLEERVAEFLEIVRPLGFHTRVKGNDMQVILQPEINSSKTVRVWVNQQDYPIFTINGVGYYCEVFYDYIWDDDVPDSMNSDMILAITAEYMKKYPDALFQFEWADDDNKFLDKSDIDAIISQPFVSDWFVDAKSHLHSAEVNRKDDSWTLS